MSSSLDYRGLGGRVRAGDRRAFDELTLAFWRPVLGYFWRRMPAAEAEDLTQTVFVNVYRALRRGAGVGDAGGLDDRESWSRYLFGAARNALRDHWRRGSERAEPHLEELFRDDETAGAASEPEGPDALEDRETRAALEDCLGELEAASRSLVWLHFVDGRSKRELARGLRRPESSVRSDMVRILDRLRRCIDAKGVAL